MSSKTRCNAFATSTNRICKCKYKYIILQKKYCHTHANILYNIYIIKIQSVFRAYFIRKKLKNIYFKLPYDIQYKILEYLQEEFYIVKQNKQLSLLINNKINNFIIFKRLSKHLILNKYYNNININETNGTSYKFYYWQRLPEFNELSYLCYLCSKYYSLISINKFNNIYYLLNIITNMKKQHIFEICAPYDNGLVFSYTNFSLTFNNVYNNLIENFNNLKKLS